MRVAVEEMDGVSDAAVSLNDGEVTIVLEDGNRVSLDRVREAVRDQGFTPREADVRVRAVPERRDDAWFLRVPGSETSYRVLATPDVVREIEAREGQPTVVRGRVGESATGRIEVMSVGDP